MFTLDFCLAGSTVIAGKLEQSSTFFTVPQAAAGCQRQSRHIRNKLPAAYCSSSAGGNHQQLRLYVNQALSKKHYSSLILVMKADISPWLFLKNYIFSLNYSTRVLLFPRPLEVSVVFSELDKKDTSTSTFPDCINPAWRWTNELSYADICWII